LPLELQHLLSEPFLGSRVARLLRVGELRSGVLEALEEAALLERQQALVERL
jgi:hypothetical protein